MLEGEGQEDGFGAAQQVHADPVGGDRGGFQEHSAGKAADWEAGAFLRMSAKAFGGDGEKAKQHGSEFAYDQADDGCCRGQGSAFLQGNLVYDIDGCYSRELLKELGSGWNGCFLKAVVIAADAGVAGSKGDCDGHNAQQAGTTGFVEYMCSKEVRIGVDQKCGKKREGKGHGESDPQDGTGLVFFPSCHFSGDETGDGNFYAGGGECIADAVDGKNHLVNADSFGTDGTA